MVISKGSALAASGLFLAAQAVPRDMSLLAIESAFSQAIQPFASAPVFGAPHAPAASSQPAPSPSMPPMFLADAVGVQSSVSASSPSPSTATAAASSSPTASDEPCKVVSDLIKQYGSAPAQKALDCLRSIPIQNDVATDYAIQIKKYLEWQSDSAFLKNPPSSGYLNGPVDLLGGIDQITWKAKLAHYDSFYDFATELEQLFHKAHDGHLAIFTCASSVFSFVADIDLVNIAPDVFGLDEPQIWTRSDAQILAAGSQGVSPIRTINGQDVVTFLGSFAKMDMAQDDDARWNTLFTRPLDSYTAGFHNAYSGQFQTRLGDYTSYRISYANGTSSSVEVLAHSRQEDLSLSSGADYYAQFCAPLGAEASNSASAARTVQINPSLHPKRQSTSTTPDAPSSLAQQFESTDQSMKGYYLGKADTVDGIDTTDIAVVQLASFEFQDFPQTLKELYDFLQEAQSNGKKKLVIDISSNPGGVQLSGPSLFKLFFPQADAWTASRFRAHEAIQYYVRAASTYDDEDYADLEARYPNAYYIPNVSAKMAVTPDQQHNFAGWRDLFGPHEIDGDAYGNLMALANFTLQSAEWLPLVGYDKSAPVFPTAPFASQNIIMVTDGICHSTCALFANLMKNVAGVRTVAFGGRHDGQPMQYVGGTKGGMVLDFQDASSVFKELFGRFVAKFPNTFTSTELRRANESMPPAFSDLPLQTNGLGVNFLNMYAPKDPDLPLQLIYEAADCRLGFTKEMFSEPERAWVNAANAAWGNARCVRGSVNGYGSVSVGGLAMWDNTWFADVYQSRSTFRD